MKLFKVEVFPADSTLRWNFLIALHKRYWQLLNHISEYIVSETFSIINISIA